MTCHLVRQYSTARKFQGKFVLGPFVELLATLVHMSMPPLVLSAANHLNAILSFIGRFQLPTTLGPEVHDAIAYVTKPVQTPAEGLPMPLEDDVRRWFGPQNVGGI